MKTLIVTCVSCLLLAGGYVSIKHHDKLMQLVSFSKPDFLTFKAFTDLESNANRKPNIDAETSLAPVETLPSSSNILSVDRAVAVAIPVENKVEVAIDTFSDSNSMLEQATADAFNEANESSQPVVAEKQPLVVNVPFIEAKDNDAKIVLEARHTIKKVKP